MNNAKNILISLTRDEALVLFDWLGNINPNLPEKIDEKIFTILCNIESSLESVLDEPFQENYIDIVNAARNRI